MTGIFHFLSRSQSSCKTVHPSDTIVLWGSPHLPSSPKMILPPQPRWPMWEWRSHLHSPSRHLRQQENHPAEPCSDAESWEIITGCSKPLSFGVICYIATDNQNIFPHAFLHNHCSLKRKKNSSRFFSVHLSLAPADFSRLSLEMSAKLVFSLFFNMSVPSTPISMILSLHQPCPKAQLHFPLINSYHFFVGIFHSWRSSTRMTFTPTWSLSSEFWNYSLESLCFLVLLFAF